MEALLSLSEDNDKSASVFKIVTYNEIFVTIKRTFPDK